MTELLRLNFFDKSLTILKSLSACSVQKYEDLENYIIATLGDPSKAVFVNALSFLFTVGRINYQESTDTINLVQR